MRGSDLPRILARRSTAAPTIAQRKPLYFSSTREDGQGDLYVSRLTKDGWSEPMNLGLNINSASLGEGVAVRGRGRPRSAGLL